MQPSRRPKDGRYGENPNRLQHYYQFQVILKPSPDDIQELYLKSLGAIGIDPKLHDIRFVEDDWESPTLGAWGLGWECWCDGMEVSQFTYFQQVAGFECAPVSGELTYGLERLAMYVQGVDRVFDLNFNGREGDEKVTYGDVFLQAEQEYSRHNFEFADTEMLFEQFKMAEAACRKYLDAGWVTVGNARRHLMALPAYDQCIKASHVFNLLDARGVISVTERQSYILRVRELAKACGEAWLATEGGGGGAWSAQPEIGGRAPLVIDVEAGKSYWWCACGRSKKQPFCDGSHKGTAFTPVEWKAATSGEGLVLRLQAHRPPADVRRES